MDGLAVIDVGQVGDGRFELVRGSDGSRLVVTLVADGDEIRAVAIDDAGVLVEDAGGFARLRPGPLASEGVEPAVDRSETNAAWIAGP